jgi:outer membrane protein assembly factor BamB
VCARPLIVPTLALVVLLAASAAAQSLPAPQAPLGLDVSLPAAKRLAGAREFIAAGEWDAAIKSLDLLAQDFGESLIEVEPARFMNVRQAVTATLARLPAPGLAVYRRRVDPAMKSLFAEAEARHSRTSMQQIVRDGFAGSYGDEALDWLAEEALETGDVESARQCWTALLPVSSGSETALVLRVPESERTPAEVCARLVLCSILEGDHVRAGREIAAFQSRFGDVDGELANRTGALGELLAGLLAESRQWSASDVTRGPSVATSSDARHLDLSTILWSHSLAPDRSNFVPAVWKDVLILPGPFSVRALSLSDGGPRWPSGALGDDGTIYSAPHPSGDPQATRPFVEINACQIADGRCYVRIGAPLSGAASHSPAVAPTRLVCLDLEAEGRLAWSVGSDEFAEFSGGRFSGSPLVNGDRVYVPVRWGAPQVEVGLACLSAETGELQWNRRLCTAMDAVPVAMPRIDHDALAAGGGLVFQLPAAGILAASDAETGELQWAVTYSTSTGQGDVLHAAGAESALVYHGGWLFAKPRDSNQLMAFHAGDGRLLWSLEPPSRIRDLLGVIDGRLIASGDQLWGFETATGKAWRFGFDDPDGYGIGRGAVAGGRIYWPTHDDLFVVEAESGQLVDRILFNPGSGLTGGNLAVAADRLMISGPSRITAVGPVPHR